MDGRIGFLFLVTPVLMSFVGCSSDKTHHDTDAAIVVTAGQGANQNGSMEETAGGTAYNSVTGGAGGGNSGDSGTTDSGKDERVPADSSYGDVDNDVGIGTGGTGGAGGTSGTGGTNLDDAGSKPIGPAPEEICARPIDLADTSQADHIVGTGTAQSCTFADLSTAVSQGGVIAFNCGPDPVIIDVTTAMQLRVDRNTTIDGGGLITLDGGRLSGRKTRIFEYDSPNFRTTDTLVLLQRLTLQNAEAPANDYTEESASNPACAYGYADGSGGAIYMRDGRLQVIDCVFTGNRAATPGPDVGGGAIYALGSNELTVVGSRFVDNQGSNSGAVGQLHTEGTFVNSVFANNQATGNGANFAGGDAEGCPGVGHPNQGGAGGNGTAIAIDGGANDHNSFCGCVFENNQGNALGTIFRTPNSGQSRLTFDRCTFVDNYAASGGGAMYVQDVDLEIAACTFAANHADGLGGAVRVEQGSYGSDMIIENSTFYNNYVDNALGGALVFSCGDWQPLPPCGSGTVRNVTFANNEARGGVGFFGAAIVNHGDRRTLTVNNTVFLNNTDSHEWTPMTCSIDNTDNPAPMPGSNNLQWPRQRVGTNNIDDNPCTAAITWADASLSSLADNGGPNATMMPKAGSQAIGAGADCPATDQRGQARPEQGCTAGAVEF